MGGNFEHFIKWKEISILSNQEDFSFMAWIEFTVIMICKKLQYILNGAEYLEKLSDYLIIANPLPTSWDPQE